MLEQDPATRYEELVERSQGPLTGLAFRVLGDRGAAEEVVQDALTTLASHPVAERPVDEVAAWLRRVTLNGAFNRLRSRKRADQRLTRLASLRPDAAPREPLDEVLAAEERERVRAVLTQLPDRQRDVLLLRSAGFAYAEIAATVGIAVGSVGVLLARGERAFRLAYLDAGQHADTPGDQS